MTHGLLIPLAVGSGKPAFSRRSVKTGGNRNISPILVQYNLTGRHAAFAGYFILRQVSGGQPPGLAV